MFFILIQVTEEEINNGILDNVTIVDPWKTSFAFIRSFIDIDSNVINDTKLAKRFIDLNDDRTIDELKRSRLNRLKTIAIQNAYKNEADKSLFKLAPVS
jgi:CO dehydrogenase/acetyl-CoA synthase epsilon subunit